MAIIKKVYVSDEQPQIIDGLWLRKIAGGTYALYYIEGGTPNIIVPVDSNSTVTPTDDTDSMDNLYDALVGANDDEATDNTINGAKAYASGAAAAAAEDAIGTVTGTASDTSEDMTLYGLKAYIDSKTGGGGGSDVEA